MPTSSELSCESRKTDFSAANGSTPISKSVEVPETVFGKYVLHIYIKRN
jgi:hypothetical protein